MQRALRPIVNEMRDGFASLKRDITSLNKTMNQQHVTIKSLSEDLEEHKNQTMSELSDLHTSMDTLDSKLDFICDKVEEHEDHVTAELIELNEYLKENFTHQIGSNDNYMCGGIYRRLETCSLSGYDRPQY